MVVTIIGSLKDPGRMKECREYWKAKGCEIHSPDEIGRQNWSLVMKMSDWIEKIRRADLVCAIPKEFRLTHGSDSPHEMVFGESTSYEIAIASYFGKAIVYWLKGENENASME